MHKGLRHGAFHASVTAILGMAAFGQSVPADTASGNQPTPVTLFFLADDSHGNPIRELTKADISLLDNKKPPQSVVELRTAKDLPLRLGLLIDTSNSQGSNELYRPAVKAAFDFLNQILGDQDTKVFIVDFSSTPKATSFMNQDQFSKAKVELSTGGGTAFYDAVNLACKERMQADRTMPARRVLIVLSDGEDNLSHVSRVETIVAAQQAGTTIFTISTNKSNARASTGDKVLERFAAETGGYSFSELGPKDMPKVFASIRAQIDSMYNLTYIPAEAGQPGHFSPIELKITSGGKWKVHAPKGYYVPSGQN